MRGMKLLGGALALGLMTVGTVARADDPNDPAMKNKAARERDRAVIRELNLRQLDYVRKRDARQAEGWKAYRDYPRQQAEYERRMAEWRRAVRLCESGHYEYCDR